MKDDYLEQHGRSKSIPACPPSLADPLQQLCWSLHQERLVVVMQSGRDNGDWRAREKGYQMIRTAVDTWLSNHTKKVLVTDPRTAKRHAHA